MTDEPDFSEKDAEHWLAKEFKRVKERRAQLPDWAKPVVTRPPLTMHRSPNLPYCGYWIREAGAACVCGDPANHLPEGKFYKE